MGLLSTNCRACPGKGVKRTNAVPLMAQVPLLEEGHRTLGDVDAAEAVGALDDGELEWVGWCVDVLLWVWAWVAVDKKAELAPSAETSVARSRIANDSMVKLRLLELRKRGVPVWG